MKIIVKLYGTLSKGVAGYNHKKGLEVEIPEGTDINKLIDHLGIPKSKVGVVTVNDRAAKEDDQLQDASRVNIFQPIAGG
jgi:sulfur carrier protein ThiS